MTARQRTAVGGGRGDLAARYVARGLAPIILLVVGGCAGTGGATAFGTGAGTGAPPSVASGAATHGRADFDWTLRTLEGKRIELAAYQGRVLFINMWATWCPPCVSELASIERLRDSLRHTDIAFLLISPEEPEPVARFLKRYRYDLPILLEWERMPDAFDLRALPTTYVVDRAGNIVLRHRGAADWDRNGVRQFLQTL